MWCRPLSPQFLRVLFSPSLQSVNTVSFGAYLFSSRNCYVSLDLNFSFHLSAFRSLHRLLLQHSNQVSGSICPHYSLDAKFTLVLLFQDLRIATTVAVVIGLFVICWTPFFALNFTYAVCIVSKFTSIGCAGLMKLPPVILQINKWLQYGNSVCNPIIYGLRNKDFRRAFRKILLGLCCKKVRLSDYSKSAYGRTVRTAYLQRESSFENSRSVIYPPNMPPGLFDMRESYRKAIQSGRSKPIKLKFTKKRLADGLLALNVDAFHSFPSPNDFTSTTNLLTSSSGVSASPAELCNHAFEDDQAETSIYPIDQAEPTRDSNENMTGSTSSLNSKKGALLNGEARVHFTDSNSPERGDESKSTPSVFPAFNRKRSLSEIFLRSSSKTDSLKQKLRSSFSQKF